jgi:hypothetical protein
MKYAIAAAVLLAAGFPAVAAEPARFDVATLKQSPPIVGDSYQITLGLVKGRRFYMTNVTLSD